ncbi:hypothetical protein SRHO_G00307230 [Serrasalmus rhombeus]
MVSQPGQDDSLTTWTGHLGHICPADIDTLSNAAKVPRSRTLHSHKWPADIMTGAGVILNLRKELLGLEMGQVSLIVVARGASESQGFPVVWP